jgi:hypothetical protein
VVRAVSGSGRTFARMRFGEHDARLASDACPALRQ